jgi:hypothetical protein
MHKNDAKSPLQPVALANPWKLQNVFVLLCFVWFGFVFLIDGVLKTLCFIGCIGKICWQILLEKPIGKTYWKDKFAKPP